MFLFVLSLKCANKTKTAFGSASKLTVLSFPFLSFAFSPLHLSGNQGQTVYQSLNTHTSLHSIASHPPIVFIKSCICEFPEVSKDSQSLKDKSDNKCLTCLKNLVHYLFKVSCVHVFVCVGNYHRLCSESH